MYLAQRSPNPNEVINGVATIRGFEWIFNNVVTVLLGFGGILLFIMLLIGGFNILTAGDNQEKAASAKKTITYAIGGLAVTALAYLILVFIQNFTGANVTVFQVYRP